MLLFLSQCHRQSALGLRRNRNDSVAADHTNKIQLSPLHAPAGSTLSRPLRGSDGGPQYSLSLSLSFSLPLSFYLISLFVSRQRPRHTLSLAPAAQPAQWPTACLALRELTRSSASFPWSAVIIFQRPPEDFRADVRTQIRGTFCFLFT